MDVSAVLVLLVLLIGILTVYSGIKIVPQSMVYVVERFGKFEKILHPGLNLLVPGLQYVAHKVSVLERQLPRTEISVITKDNVNISLTISVFYRVVQAEHLVYRIQDADEAVATTTAAILRAACGELEFDDVQRRREFLNQKIKSALADATSIWGLEITRTEVLDVTVDEETKKQMQRQITAERERRAIVMKAEGDREAVQKAADAEFYKAQKYAEAVRVKAEADAYATSVVAQAIAENGQPAIDFEIMKRKVEALATLGKSENSKLLVLPSEITEAFGGLMTITELWRNQNNRNRE